MQPIKLFKNLNFAIIFTVLCLTSIGLILPTFWFILFDSIMSYLITDFLLSIFLIGGSLVGFPLGKESKEKGYIFLAYAIGMVIAGSFSYYVDLAIVNVDKTILGWGLTVFILDIVVALSILITFRAKFYAKVQKI